VPSGRSLLTGLIRALDAADLELDAIELRRPTLDDVFLTLTGHSLRDGESDTTGAAA
jgi:ABC-2 type transport system ATP-binding protein